MTATDADARPLTWPTHDGQVVAVVFSGGRYYVQLRDAHGRVHTTCDPHGYHERRPAVRAARRLWPVTS